MTPIIFHLDGDAFFASCEVALRPSLAGRPVVTGRDRGIATSLSYEAKARGVRRGMPIYQVKQICPEAVILHSHYSVYAKFSRRLFEIVRRHGAVVEEYSIDECFADLSGRRLGPRPSDYAPLGQKMKAVIERELGVTFSVGIATTKVLAKVASKWQKPNGFAVIDSASQNDFLKQTPLEKVWGIGPKTTLALGRLGLKTGFDLARQPENWARQNLHKSTYEIWLELNGHAVYPVDPAGKTSYQSIQKTLTFTPPSTDPKFLWAELARNTESACRRARAHGLAAGKIFFFLKTQKFLYHGALIKLAFPLALPTEILPLLKVEFAKIYRPHTPYRTTGITLAELEPITGRQNDLFGSWAKIDAKHKLFESIDEINERFGPGRLRLGASFFP